MFDGAMVIELILTSDIDMDSDNKSRHTLVNSMQSSIQHRIFTS